MGKHRVKPVYFLPILLRAHGESNPEKHIELSIAGVREKDKIATIKDLIEIKYEIPRDHQTLRGPLPSKKILLDSKSLRRSRIVLGRVILPGAKRMDPRLHGSDEEDEDESTLVSAEPPSLVTDAASTSGRSMPGLLFSTGGPFLEGRGKTIRMGDEGSAGMGTTVDLIELITRHPPAHYSQGGDYYEAQRRRQRLQYFGLALLAILLMFAVVYLWWIIPYYKLPAPQHWMADVETKFKQATLNARLRQEGVDLAQFGILEDSSAKADDVEQESLLLYLYERLTSSEL
mmetsp:Transcript_1635/g.2819  ORF Transcript_1635/g.2819 Transcript_1635/m.2819 type:complete len:288 (-) Transcript_1635:113-976(-)